MRLQQKSLSRLTLESLLRKKRTNLESFLKETGIVAYDTLVSRCNSIGVVPPEREEFTKAMGNPVVHEYSSPTEGIIVLNPQENTEDIAAATSTSSDVEYESEAPKKKKRKTISEL